MRYLGSSLEGIVVGIGMICITQHYYEVAYAIALFMVIYVGQRTVRAIREGK